MFPAASRVSLTVGEIWECGKGVEMGVGNLENAEINAFSAVFKKVWECGNNFQETENFMEFKNVFQEMLNVTAAPPAPPEATPPLNPAAAALQRAGIPTDAPYYAGAFRNVEQAMENRKPASRRFWEAYLLSLCGHLERLEREAGNPSVSATHCQLPYRGAYSGEDCMPSVSLAAASSAQGTSFGRPFRGAEIERQLLRGGIRTVQAVLYALQETERTESEPRETD